MKAVLLSACFAVPVAISSFGCGDADPDKAKVIAATSLKQAMEPLVDAYNDQNPSVKVETSFAPSDQIERQIESGYDADVIATASAKNMRPLVDAELAEHAAPLAGNTMIVAVADHAADAIATPRDLAGDVRISMGDSSVPIGSYGQAAIDLLDEIYGGGFAEKVGDNVVNRAGSAADVITPVALGGVDASVSYATDARANADRVTVVEIPDRAQPRIAYWAAESPTSSIEGQEFFDFIQSPDGQKVLAQAGFTTVDAAAGEKP